MKSARALGHRLTRPAAAWLSTGVKSLRAFRLMVGGCGLTTHRPPSPRVDHASSSGPIAPFARSRPGAGSQALRRSARTPIPRRTARLATLAAAVTRPAWVSLSPMLTADRTKNASIALAAAEPPPTPTASSTSAGRANRGPGGCAMSSVVWQLSVAFTQVNAHPGHHRNIGRARSTWLDIQEGNDDKTVLRNAVPRSSQRAHCSTQRRRGTTGRPGSRRAAPGWRGVVRFEPVVRSEQHPVGVLFPAPCRVAP